MYPPTQFVYYRAHATGSVYIDIRVQKAIWIEYFEIQNVNHKIASVGIYFISASVCNYLCRKAAEEWCLYMQGEAGEPPSCTMLYSVGMCTQQCAQPPPGTESDPDRDLEFRRFIRRFSRSLGLVASLLNSFLVSCGHAGK